MDHRRQQRGAVDHGGVDDLALARTAGLDQGGAHAEGEQHPAAPEVADQVERRDRALSRPADRVEGAGEGDVVDVVAGGRRVGPVLAPAGHPAVDEAGVAGQADVGAETEPLGDARAGSPRSGRRPARRGAGPRPRRRGA